MKKYIALIGLLWIAHVSWAQLHKTAYGFYAGYNSQGDYDSFFGSNAGFESDASEGGNSFLGTFAGFNNVGSKNTNVGMWAGGFNSGNNNVYIGNLVGNRSKGHFNVFIGSQAGSSGNKGSNNVFLGYESGFFNQTGRSNTFLGKESGHYNKSGYENLFAGYKSGFKNLIGFRNVFLGHYSGYYNESGVRNTFIGTYAGYRNVSGHKNVFIGYMAGYYEEGNDKLYIANSSTPLLYGNFQKKNVSIGGKVDSDYTLYVLGEAFSTGNWVSSDRRYKKDIKEIESAAEKILALEGKSYAFKENARIQNDSSVARLTFSEGRQFGFLAQEMKEVLPELVREDEEGYLAVNYDGIIPVLVEAFKELKVTNEKLQKEITSLQKEIAGLSGKSIAPAPGQKGKQELADDITEQTDILHQNVPNPFDQSTEIRYQVAGNARQVSLHVYDLQGNEMVQFTNLPAGNGSVKIPAFRLKAGMYLYSLRVDSKVLDTRRMIVIP